MADLQRPDFLTSIPDANDPQWKDNLVRAVNYNLQHSSLNAPITGAGSPEGVVTANITQRYMDTLGVAGSILYIKQSGSGNTGWILV